MSDTYRTTMEDVARAAGVSRTTVSFVLNNRNGARIAPETRDRVQQVAAELGYRPHGGARALASRRSSLIGLVSEIVTSPFGAATIRGIQDTVRRAGYTLFIVPTSTEADMDAEAFETLLKSRVEGIIYATGWNCRVRMPAQAREIPTVLVHCIDPVSGLPCVRPDEEQMGRLAAQASSRATIGTSASSSSIRMTARRRPADVPAARPTWSRPASPGAPCTSPSATAPPGAGTPRRPAC
ncbi:transcriptional regulator, LacI family [Actinomyces naeslundii str. Howell 279]|uniref:Transcriptional regulator, LacI family n=1 Tax=Actinomyces naeslundii (strain ATCC 12104 / DSM 43013 / CCUG 2238 / JCM 8349 / NCTC 10301 / Howell 279) TaxID=1115803 RepID=J3JLD4_ACTNH|nr:transcriptional regulator, LacI family [Actinomyces naeslundii str. Howell 279]